MWFAQCFCHYMHTTRSDQISLQQTPVTVTEHACVCVCVGGGVYTYEYYWLSLRRVTALSSLTDTWLLSPMLWVGLCILAVHLFSPFPPQSFTHKSDWFCDNFLPAFPCPAFWFKWLLAQPTHCLFIKMETRCHPGLNDTKLFHLLHMFYSKQTWYVKVCFHLFLFQVYLSISMPMIPAYKKKRFFSY